MATQSKARRGMGLKFCSGLSPSDMTWGIQIGHFMGAEKCWAMSEGTVQLADLAKLMTAGG